MVVLSKEIDPSGLTDPAKCSYVFSIKHKDLYSAYKTLTHSRWTVEEVDMSRDLADFKTLTPNEQHFIMNVLMFFKGGDGVVIENLFTSFMEEVAVPEARAFFSEQMSQEQVHSEMYFTLILTFAGSPEIAEELLASVNGYPCVQKKMDWAVRWMKDRETDFRERLIAFVAVEGILFSSSFCAIFWLRKRGLCHGLTFSNELISRDESLHTEFGILLYSKLAPLPTETVHRIFREAVEVESAFVREGLPESLTGIDAESMIQFVQFVTDRLLNMIGIPLLYEVKNPFGFMDMISLHDKPQFFERQPVYMLGDLSNSGPRTPMNFTLDLDD